MTPEKNTQAWSFLLRRIASLLLAYALLIMGNALGSTQTSLSLIEMGADVTFTGMVQSAFYLGFFLGGFFCSPMVYRYGHHRSFAALAAFISVAALLQSLLEFPWVWLFTRFANGFAILGIYMVVESWLHAAVGDERRGQLFSLYMIISYMGASAGQWLLKLPLTQPSWQFVVVAMLFVVSTIPVTLTRQTPLPNKPSELGRGLARTRATLLQLHQSAPLSLYGMLAAGCLSSAFYSLLPVMLSALSYARESVGDFMGIVLLAGPVLQWPIGRWGDRSARRSRPLLFTASVVLLLSFILAFWHAEVIRLPVTLLYVALSFTWYTSLSGIANSAMPLAYRVELSAVLLMLYALGGIFGPIVGALFMAKLGAQAGYFGLSAFLAACICGWVLWQERPVHQSV